MLKKKLKWYPLFESKEDLEVLFVGKQAVVHRSVFGEVLLVRERESYYAFKNKCPHQNKPLEGCSVEESHVVCPYHRHHFSLENGRGHGLSLLKYELKFDEGRVLLGKEVWSLF